MLNQNTIQSSRLPIIEVHFMLRNDIMHLNLHMSRLTRIYAECETLIVANGTKKSVIYHTVIHMELCHIK
jgi:hypothetical protein